MGSDASPTLAYSSEGGCVRRSTGRFASSSVVFEEINAAEGRERQGGWTLSDEADAVGLPERLVGRVLRLEEEGDSQHAEPHR